jgi:transposase
MSMTKQKYKNDCIIFDTLENLVPRDHLVRKIERCMDFTFIEYEVKGLYSSVGCASIPPVVLFKLLLINKIFDRILEQAMDYNFIDMETVFGDSTHQKANANKNNSK